MEQSYGQLLYPSFVACDRGRLGVTFGYKHICNSFVGVAKLLACICYRLHYVRVATRIVVWGCSPLHLEHLKQAQKYLGRKLCHDRDQVIRKPARLQEPWMHGES